MMTINKIFRQHADEYITKFGAAMPQSHLKVIEAIVNCRTDTYGMAFYECDQCHSTHMVYRSCGNRHCPLCQPQDSAVAGASTRPAAAGASFHDHLHNARAAPVLHPQPSAMRPCSRHRPRPLNFYAPTKSTSGAICPVFSACCTPGGEPCSIIPTFIMWSPAAPYPKQTADGIPRDWIFMCRSRRCPRSFAPSSAMKSKSTGCSAACPQRLGDWLLMSIARPWERARKASVIWPLTFSKWPCPTAASSRSKTKASISATKSLKANPGARWTWTSHSSCAGFCSMCCLPDS